MDHAERVRKGESREGEVRIAREVLSVGNPSEAQSQNTQEASSCLVCNKLDKDFYQIFQQIWVRLLSQNSSLRWDSEQFGHLSIKWSSVCGLLTTRVWRRLRGLLLMESPTHYFQYSNGTTSQGSSVCRRSFSVLSILVWDDPSRSSVCGLSSLLLILSCDDPPGEFYLWTLLLTILHTRVGRPLRGILFVDSPNHYSSQ